MENGGKSHLLGYGAQTSEKIGFCRRKSREMGLCPRGMSVMTGKGKKTELYIKISSGFFQNPLDY